MSLKPMLVLRVESQTENDDHVTMDGVRWKLQAVWKTGVQTDWSPSRGVGGEGQSGEGGEVMGDRTCSRPLLNALRRSLVSPSALPPILKNHDFSSS